MKNLLLKYLLGLLVLAWGGAARAQDFKIEPVRGNVYRFTAGSYCSVFMVAEDGIVVADPLSTEAAAWLKSELARRFAKPIRTVIYSHNHSDHVYGGEALDGQNVRFVSHELARQDLVRTKARTRIPDTTFTDKMTVREGSSRVELRYHGVNNGRGSISMLFEPAHVLHIVDWVVLGRMPWKDLQGYDIEGMISSGHQVLAMDFDLFVGGHADIGGKAEVRRSVAYLEALYDAVLQGIRDGKDLPTLQREIKLDEFRDLKMYNEWLPLNIAGAYKTLADESYILMRPDIPQPK